MFEAGKKYEIKMIIDSEETTMWRTVENYEHPLIKFADVHSKAVGEFLKPKILHGEIINVTSPNFISAKIAAPALTLQEIADENAKAQARTYPDT